MDQINPNNSSTPVNPVPPAAPAVAKPAPRAKSKLIASISPDLCSGCEACISVMPNDRCIVKNDAEAGVPFGMIVVDVQEDKCTGCTLCMRICPWEAITMIPRPVAPVAAA